MTAALLRGALVGVAMLGMPAAPTVAEPVLRPDLTDRVGGREDVTFADLVRLVVPGIAGNETIDVRDIDGEFVEDLESVSGAALRLSAVPEPGTRAITVAYRWDDGEQRYIPDFDPFDVLARENEARF